MADLNMQEGQLFSDKLLKEVNDKFYYVNQDPITKKKRVFFDNAGGAFRLKSVLESYQKVDAIPDCPERKHEVALHLQEIIAEGERDSRIIFNAQDGKILTMLTASRAIFELVGAVAETIEGTNVVTTDLEHPSSYDAVAYYAQKTGKELRVAKTNPVTGGVDADEIASLIDENTCLLNFIYASNISGAILDVEEIVKAARKKKTDLYITVDAVQHIPHGHVDVSKLEVDGMNFAPYKFFGNRGSGIAYVSERLSKLPHPELLAKEPTWQLGSPAPSQFAAITEIVDYVCWLGSNFIITDDRRELFVEGMDRIKLQERALMNYMLKGESEVPGLRNIRGVNVYLDHPDFTKRDFIVAMSFDNLACEDAVKEYAKRDIIVYERLNSSIYSKRMLDSFGIEGCIRVSPLHCQSIEDMQVFLKATLEIAESIKER
ncbi:aminotransferase class V-fold PLP-dependent enzyme [Candidatus Enterococcus ferrettii]|uniref:Aminotransferase class V domain-containing protein n=1 Tax=Candidatus Enterococcus ferrettii TaxID=2815324 RepID=A0ABV0ETC3_9ENTE|nr:aminotransferase class V-fold PLP-dependent enzyme [Enterococcus sp. 665A]MBO1338899.1 aminotransferase class V-fold PLP-dependent enzyme [Enterococcus sp. 665A]